MLVSKAVELGMPVDLPVVENEASLAWEVVLLELVECVTGGSDAKSLVDAMLIWEVVF